MSKLMVPALAMLAPMLVLTACNSAPPPPPPQPKPPTGTTLKVLQLDDKTRNVVFMRALYDSNIPCENVTKSERVPDIAGAPYWRVYCKNNGVYLITVTTDGTANILSHP